jgi:hypothetical protein
MNLVIEDDPLPNLTLIQYLESKDIKYIPELYRQKLIELANLDEEGFASSYLDWPDVLQEPISAISEKIEYQFLLSLRLSHQESLMMLYDLKFFIGLMAFIPHPAGGYPPVMYREA